MSEYTEYSENRLLDEIEAYKEIIASKSESVFMRMLHELQIQQMELELQKRELQAAKQELEQTRNLHVDWYDFAPFAYFTFDNRGSILELNLAGSALLGKERLSLLGMSFVDFIAKEDRIQFLSYVQECINGKTQSSKEFSLVLADGKSIKIKTTKVFAQVARGYIDACSIAFVDVTERKLSDLKMRLAGKIMENTLEGILLMDAHQRIVAVNPAFLKSSGYGSDELIGYTPLKLKSDHHDENFYTQMNAELKLNDSWQGEVWNRSKNGDSFPEWMNIKAVRNAEGVVDCYVGVFTDQSKGSVLTEHAPAQPYYDPLTGLANKSLLYDRMQHELLQCKRGGDSMAIFLLDLNHFHEINDQHGLTTGDHVLKEAAERLACCVRAGDTLSRLEGDEFVAILHNIGNTDVPGRIAERMVQALDKPFKVDNGELFVTASVGISVSPEDGDDVTELLEHADEAMFMAKQLGKSNFRFYGSGMGKQA